MRRCRRNLCRNGGTAREPTVMAMLECYEPLLVAWRNISRLLDAFEDVFEACAAAVK